MYFIDKNCEKFFLDKIGQVKNIDIYNLSLIYLLSNNKETQKHFENIFDINKNEINISIFEASWQTNTSLNICRLAFNLYGDISNDNLESNNSFFYTVSSIFKNIDIKLGIQAIKLRFKFTEM